jgi:hypothetical protein
MDHIVEMKKKIWHGKNKISKVFSKNIIDEKSELDDIVTSETKIHTSSHSYMHVSMTLRTSHRASRISPGRCVHKLKTPARIFHR